MARMSLWNDDVGAAVRDSARITVHSPENKRVTRLFSVTTGSANQTNDSLRRLRLAAFFEFFEGGLELREHKLAVLGDVGDSYLPVFDGVGLVAESRVGAS
jgi:hypothetical protein